MQEKDLPELFYEKALVGAMFVVVGGLGIGGEEVRESSACTIRSCQKLLEPLMNQRGQPAIFSAYFSSTCP